MVIEYLQQIKDSLFRTKTCIRKTVKFIGNSIKRKYRNDKKCWRKQMIRAMNCLHLTMFNSKNKAKINELMEEQKSINESIENLKNSIK